MTSLPHHLDRGMPVTVNINYDCLPLADRSQNTQVALFVILSGICEGRGVIVYNYRIIGTLTSDR